MNIREKLQITIITYNRDIYLERTLNFLTQKDSPIKDFDFLVLDNASTDNTYNIIKDFQKKFPNIQYYRNTHNIGANANIVRAFEMNKKDYIWVLGDCYLYNWNNWDELENAILSNKPAIVVTRDAIPVGEENIPHVLNQSGFLAACIYSKDLISGSILKQMYDNIYTMFPHVVPLVAHVNNGGDFSFVTESIVSHAYWQGERKGKKYEGWYRDFKKEELYPKSSTMSYILGLLTVLSVLKNKEYKKETIKILYKYQRKLGINNPFKGLTDKYIEIKDLSQLADLYVYSNPDKRSELAQMILSIFPLKEIIVNLFTSFFRRFKYTNLYLGSKICTYRFLAANSKGYKRKRYIQKIRKNKKIKEMRRI